MQNNFDTIQKYIDDAYLLAENHEFDVAINHFFALRMLLQTSKVDGMTSQDTVAENTTYIENEARNFKDIVAKANPYQVEPHDTLCIIGDSLHLPRPEETTREDFGFPLVCSHYLQKLIEKDLCSYRVQTWAQRYYTTSSIVQNWKDILPDTLENTHLVIHVGLNDYVERMFLEEERLAMDLYPEVLKLKIVKFAQLYRKEIIHRQLGHSYVPFPKFKKNIQEIIVRAKIQNVKSLSFVNIIALPSKSWVSTPRSMWNTSRFNMFLYDMQQQHNINIIDLDRLVWENGLHENLLADKMHLSSSGHQLLAKNILTTIKGIS